MRTDAKFSQLMKRLSYICCVQRIPVSKLPFDTLLGNLTFDIPESYEWPVVKCQKPAKLEITDKIEDGERFYTHKLTFRTCREDLDMKDNYAYLVTTIEGKRYLIGNRERPYPIINMSDIHPDSLGTSAMLEYTVQWGSTRKATLLA